MSVTLLLGPVSSEKTSKLCSIARRQVYTKRKLVTIKYAKDVRYGDDDALHSHNGAMVYSHRVLKLADVDTALLEEAYLILIDEGQFFKDLQSFVTHWANRGKHVTVAALNGDFLQNSWPPVTDLIPHVEYIEKFNAVCIDCGSECGAFTVKQPSNTSLEVEDLGGFDKYKTVCRACLVKMHDKNGLVQMHEQNDLSCMSGENA